MTTWRDTLAELKEELAEVRAERRVRDAEEDAELQRQRAVLSELVESLEISDLLTEMDRTLLDGGGSIETILSWETEGEDDDMLPYGPEEEEGDVIALILTWVEGGEREIAVDVGVSEDGTYVQVNGVEIRPERAALEAALVEAFREELDL